jgi:hypothetical protein
MPEFPVSEFMARQIHKLSERSKSYRAKSNNASMVGHPCERFLVYKRRCGDEAAPPSPSLIALFEEGNTQEIVAVQMIQNFGYYYERSQESFEVKDCQIAGKMDGVTIQRSNGRASARWASEIKSVNEYTYDKLNNANDLLTSSHWHYRWYVQLQLAIYHVMTREGFDDIGVMWLKNRNIRMIKPISIPFDAKVIDHTFGKAKRVNQHLHDNTDPARIPFTKGICINCDFKFMCNPEEIFKAGKNIVDPEFVAKLKRREAIHEASKEFSKIDKEVKEILKEVPYAVAGPFIITGKKTAKSWKTEITRAMDDDAAEVINQVITPEVVEEDVTPAANDFIQKISVSKTIEQLTVVKGEINKAKGLLSKNDQEVLRSAFKNKRNMLKKMEGVL